MSQKRLVLDIILSGQINSDFYKLGAELSLMGELLDQIGSKAREYEKESLETYKNYETYMLEAKGALTAQYESSSQLERVMENLHSHAQEWAATTIFDTKDVAESISEAAHAGWTYEEMAEGIPQAMLLAQAGNLSLSDSLNYVIKALNATGTEFEDGSAMIDQWVMASNSGSTNAGELGEALLRMGKTASFGDSTAELFTMLAVLADAGTVGSDAGTLLRNSMIRLIAPTEKASKMMAKLNVTEAERLSIASDSETLSKANKLLAETGFSAYDSNGDLKPFLQTYRELYSAVSAMSEVDKNAVLSTIFPTRTISGALAILEAAANNYDNLYEKILGSNGYADSIAKIQTSGLMGAEKAFDSKKEEFSRKVGETLAPVKEEVLEMLGEIVDYGNEMPEEALAALVGAMSGLAVTGPALATVGGAIKLISALGPLGGGLLLASVGLGAFVGYAGKLAEIDLEGAFGNLELDIEKIGKYVDTIETKFSVENSAVFQYATALATAQENYIALTSTLEENLLYASLTGAKLTDEEISNITKIGNNIGDAVLDGIEAARGESLSFLDVLFGDAEVGSDEAEVLENLTGWTNSWADDLNAEAYQIGAQLRTQMVAALMDGELDAQEKKAIEATQSRLDQIMAEIAAGMDRKDYLKELHKARSISWDSLEGYLELLDEKQKEKLEKTEEAHHEAWASYRLAWENEYAKATTDAHRQKLEAEWEETEAMLKGKLEEAKQSVRETFNELSYEAFSASMRGSDHGQAWEFLETLWKNETPTLSNGAWDFGNIDLTKYLPAGTSADEMLGMLLDLSKAEKNHDLSGVMDSYTDGKVANMFDSAIDAQVELQFDVNSLNSELDAILGSEAAKIEAEASISPGGDEAGSEFAENAQTSIDDAMLSGSVMLNDGYAEGEFFAEEVQNALDENPGDMDVSVPSGYAEGVAYAQQFQAGIDSQHVGISVSSGSGGSSKSSSKGGFIGSIGKILGFAEGGRSAEPAIFGEAGPEWAIPEEHSTRTAELLNQARRASGFTWGDLISRNGGLNGTPNSKTIHLTYAPTINAGNADGVERALAQDKNRLMAMMRSMMDEMNMRDDAEVYS